MSSDFLSKFTNEQYAKQKQANRQTVNEEKVKPELKPEPKPDITGSEPMTEEHKPVLPVRLIDPVDPVAVSKPRFDFESDMEDEPEDETDYLSRDLHAEESVKDPTYRRKQIIRWSITAAAVLVVLVLGFFLYHKWTHVTMPDFTGKNFSEARQWAGKNDITLEGKKEFSTSFVGNVVISQENKAGSKVKKGSLLTLTVSIGADPDEAVALPDFSTMTQDEAQQFIDAQKLSNIALIREFSDTVEAGKFLKLEIKDKSVSAETYRRRDSAVLSFSKGKETFEKTIAVPDFAAKAKAEVETWVKANEIEMTYKEEPHDKLEEGMVIRQSIAAGTKVAKKDQMEVTISQGKAVIVPNYAEYGPEDAATANPDMVVQVKHVLTEALPYGTLVSQSIEAGTQLLGKDDKKITVTYSIGQPYIKDLRGSLTEGELQKFMYDEFQSKGAPNITYSIAYMDSYEKKGTVVEHTPYASYLSLNSHITFYISLGNLESPTPDYGPAPQEPSPNQQPEPSKEPGPSVPGLSEPGTTSDQSQMSPSGSE